MSDLNYDIVIIGAGPAGMGCAIPLQQQNASLCVIDRAVFPRDKTCAGLVTAKTRRLIQSLFGNREIDDLFCCAPKEVKLYNKQQLLAGTPLENPVHLVNRRDFDNALVEEYKRLGGVLREGEKQYQIDYDKRRITLSNGDVISYTYLLFADGALSISRRLLHIDKQKLAFGVEAYLPADKLNTDSVDLYFGYLDSGYAWVFPHGDTVCVGLADLYDSKTDYRRLLTDFLTDLGVSADGVRYVGAFLPYGTVIPQEKLADNILLLGDAGGFTDPISGEGLYMALQSGAYAAKALNTYEPKEVYLDSMEKIIRIVRDGKKVQKTFYAPLIHKAFLKKVNGKSGLVKQFFENMVEDYRYEYRNIRKMYSDYQSQEKS